MGTQEVKEGETLANVILGNITSITRAYFRSSLPDKHRSVGFRAQEISEEEADAAKYED